jgi:N-acetylmuramoyl-L-alanine amidase
MKLFANYSSNYATKFLLLILVILLYCLPVYSLDSNKTIINSLKFNRYGNAHYIIFNLSEQRKPEINVNSTDQQVKISLNRSRLSKKVSIPPLGKENSIKRFRYKNLEDKLQITLDLKRRPLGASYSYKDGSLCVSISTSERVHKQAKGGSKAGSGSNRTPESKKQTDQPSLKVYDVGPFSILEGRDNAYSGSYFKPATRPDTATVAGEDNNKLFNLYNNFTSRNDPILNTALGKKVIVIDPGHGGNDHGSTGKYFRTREKDITLRYSNALAETLNKSGKYIVYLTRHTDRNLTLLQRIWLVRHYKADLFISIHADSASSPSARGASVYTFSEVASDRAAANLARSQNQDNLGSESLISSSEDKMVEEALYSFITRYKRNSSSRFANKLIDYIRSHSLLVKNARKYGNFQVLRNGEIPGVLLELGYLSNKQDETKLNLPETKYKFADSILKSIDSYFESNE